jgi:hypothetical protein
MMTHYPRPRSTREAQAGLYYATRRLARPNPVAAAFRWRYELLATACLAAVGIQWGWFGLVALTTSLTALLISTACLWPQGWRFVRARIWCIITPHRIRAGCVQAWIHTRSGKLPIIVATTSQPFGERVYLWCRAGLSINDFVAARENLAAACWADDIRVSRDPGYAHLITLDVIRRGSPVVPRALEPSDEAVVGSPDLPGREPVDGEYLDLPSDDSSLIQS